MFCKYCGAKLPDGSKFCSSCGKSLVADGAPGAPGAKPAGGPGGAGPRPAQQPNMQARPQNGPRPAGQRPMNAYPQARPAAAGTGKKEYTAGTIAYWVGCLMAVLGVFFDYVSSLGISISLLGLAGEEEDVMILVVIFLAIPIAGAILNALKLNIGCVIIGVVQLAFAFFIRTGLKSELGGWSGMVKFELGANLQILAGIVMIVAAIAGIVLCNKKKNVY